MEVANRYLLVDNIWNVFISTILNVNPITRKCNGDVLRKIWVQTLADQVELFLARVHFIPPFFYVLHVSHVWIPDFLYIMLVEFLKYVQSLGSNISKLHFSKTNHTHIYIFLKQLCKGGVGSEVLVPSVQIILLSKFTHYLTLSSIGLFFTLQICQLQ